MISTGITHVAEDQPLSAMTIKVYEPAATPAPAVNVAVLPSFETFESILWLPCQVGITVSSSGFNITVTVSLSPVRKTILVFEGIITFSFILLVYCAVYVWFCVTAVILGLHPLNVYEAADVSGFVGVGPVYIGISPYATWLVYNTVPS